jgi:hypothetical protein
LESEKNITKSNITNSENELNALNLCLDDILKQDPRSNIPTPSLGKIEQLEKDRNKVAE